MKKQLIDDLWVFGEPLMDAHAQLKTCMMTGNAIYGALMADHHVGYSAPVGSVIARLDEFSPSEVGYDIACGNKAVRTNLKGSDIRDQMPRIMDEVFAQISFGVGRKKNEEVDHELFEDRAWDDIPLLRDLEPLARAQLGTVGSGNHYVDIFVDDYDHVWIGVHFGSRGLGHKIASHYIAAGGGTDGMNVAPVILPAQSALGEEYWMAMNVAGRYAYAGRDWVCSKVASILGGTILEEVHNHHNFCWLENGLYVNRKGATPAYPGQWGFIGASMAENSVIVRGVVSPHSADALYSTVHGAGRVLSRTQAAGKFVKVNGRRVRDASTGQVSTAMMNDWVRTAGVELRGAGVDESPHCYKRLDEVLEDAPTVAIVLNLTPLGVAMAGSNEFDPYKD
jgi:tRNA-splicing ligase RtcB (3'-phosphate/5'-hydroxy nucleic acid ligase)